MKIPVIRQLFQNSTPEKLETTLEVLEAFCEFRGVSETEIDVVGEMITNICGALEVHQTVKEGAEEKIIGVSRYSLDAENGLCECALAVSDDWHHNGVGTALMKHLIEIARENRITSMESTEYAGNGAMRTLLQELGFHMRKNPDDARLARYTLALNPA